jgi:hypothetical protein
MVVIEAVVSLPFIHYHQWCETLAMYIAGSNARIKHTRPGFIDHEHPSVFGHRTEN